MIRVVCIFISFILCLSTNGQSENYEYQKDLAFFNATNKWFSAWKLLSEDIYKIEKVRPVEFVFFDDKYVYSTSTITIKNGSLVKGCNLMNLKLKWKKSLHNDTLTLPDNSVIPVNLMSFSAQIPNKNNDSFFVIPLPSYWKKNEITSKELGLENLITGVFIHEFSHSQQMQNFGKKITAFENQYSFNVEFNDDVVQNIFGKDSIYVNFYNKEVEHFYNSIKGYWLDKKILPRA